MPCDIFVIGTPTLLRRGGNPEGTEFPTMVRSLGLQAPYPPYPPYPTLPEYDRGGLSHGPNQVVRTGGAVQLINDRVPKEKIDVMAPSDFPSRGGRIERDSQHHPCIEGPVDTWRIYQRNSEDSDFAGFWVQWSQFSVGQGHFLTTAGVREIVAENYGGDIPIASSVTQVN